MSFSGIYLTNVGRAVLSKVQASGATLNFSQFAFGDGQLSGELETDRTAMIAQKDTQPITKLRVNGDNTVTIGTKRPGDAVGGYYFRELGLFVTDPDNSANEILYAYANAGSSAQYIPVTGSAEIVEKTINIIASISNAISITATVTTGVYVTPEELEEQVALLQPKITILGLLKCDEEGDIVAAVENEDYATPESLATKQNLPSQATALPASGTALTDNTEYRPSAVVGTYAFAWPSGNFEVWLKFTTDATFSITFPSGTMYIGGAPSFSASTTYEMSVKDGVVICQEVAAS